jgi:hypothetical protein
MVTIKVLQLGYLLLGASSSKFLNSNLKMSKKPLLRTYSSHKSFERMNKKDKTALLKTRFEAVYAVRILSFNALGSYLFLLSKHT